jgi:hypothetical protein
VLPVDDGEIEAEAVSLALGVAPRLVVDKPEAVLVIEGEFETLGLPEAPVEADACPDSVPLMEFSVDKDAEAEREGKGVLDGLPEGDADANDESEALAVCEEEGVSDIEGEAELDTVAEGVCALLVLSLDDELLECDAVWEPAAERDPVSKRDKLGEREGEAEALVLPDTLGVAVSPLPVGAGVVEPELNALREPLSHALVLPLTLGELEKEGVADEELVASTVREAKAEGDGDAELEPAAEVDAVALGERESEGEGELRSEAEAVADTLRLMVTEADTEALVVEVPEGVPAAPEVEDGLGVPEWLTDGDGEGRGDPLSRPLAVSLTVSDAAGDTDAVALEQWDTEVERVKAMESDGEADAEAIETVPDGEDEPDAEGERVAAGGDGDGDAVAEAAPEAVADGGMERDGEGEREAAADADGDPETDVAVEVLPDTEGDGDPLVEAVPPPMRDAVGDTLPLPDAESQREPAEEDDATALALNVTEPVVDADAQDVAEGEVLARPLLVPPSREALGVPVGAPLAVKVLVSQADTDALREGEPQPDGVGDADALRLLVPQGEGVGDSEGLPEGERVTVPDALAVPQDVAVSVGQPDGEGLLLPVGGSAREGVPADVAVSLDAVEDKVGGCDVDGEPEVRKEAELRPEAEGEPLVERVMEGEAVPEGTVEPLRDAVAHGETVSLRVPAGEAEGEPEGRPEGEPPAEAEGLPEGEVMALAVPSPLNVPLGANDTVAEALGDGCTLRESAADLETEGEPDPDRVGEPEGDTVGVKEPLGERTDVGD